MSTSNRSILRFRLIDEVLTQKNKPYPSLDDILDYLNEKLLEKGLKGTSKRTTQKDIERMRSSPELAYYAPIEYSTKEKGYFYSETNFSINKLPLRSDERHALEFTANLISRFHNIPVFANFKNVTQKIFDSLNLHSSLGSDELFEQSIQFDQKPVIKGSNWLEILSEAIKNYRKIEIAYKPFNVADESIRILHPYILKEYKDRWYLIALRDDIHKMRTYSLDRIERIEIKDQNFPLDLEFDRLKFFKHSYGIFNFDGQEPSTIKLFFDKTQTAYISTRPLHDTQKILSQDEAGSYVQLQVYISEDFIIDLMSFGVSVKVIEPQSLASEIRDRHLKAYNLYCDK